MSLRTGITTGTCAAAAAKAAAMALAGAGAVGGGRELARRRNASESRFFAAGHSTQ